MNPRTARLLVVDDDRAFRISTAEILRADGHEVSTAGTGTEALATVAEDRFDLILLDLRMPGPDGLAVVEQMRRHGVTAPVLFVSGFGTVEAAVRSMHLGADDFLTKPVEPDVLRARVAELLERRPSREATEDFAGLVGRSQVMRDVFEAIRQVAETDTSVLVTGETGTGKELVARAIHRRSKRSGGPFVPINCAALAEGLLESELFGHVKGAFTGAVSDKPGLFEAAAGGTLLLDEIGDVSLPLQQRLLRVLQDREVRRVGALQSRPVDARVLAATSRDLRAEVAASRFREDLFYRLNVFRIALPPLRDRVGDVPLLVEAGLARLKDRLPGGCVPTVSPFAIRLLRAHAWPGNVRELFAVLESAAVRADGRRIDAQHLPPELRGRAATTTRRYTADRSADDERAAIRAALRATGGSRTEAARALGMSRTTLWRKMRDYDLDRSEGEDNA